MENPLWKPPSQTVLIGRYAREAFLRQDLSMKEKSDRENIFSKTDFFSLSHKQKQIFTRNKREGAVSCKALCELFIYPAPSVKRDRNGERKKKILTAVCWKR